MNSIKLTILSLIFLFYISLNSSLAQWVQVSNGMGNVVVRALAYSGNNIYAGVQDAGVYLSTNNGTNWTQTSLNTQDVYSLAANGNYVFVGTGPNGIYRSTDNGTSWTLTSVTGLYVYSLAVSGNNVFGGVSAAGVFLSTNNGSSWTQAGLSGRYVYALAVNGNNIFAGTRYNNDVYLSTNNGTNWTQIPLVNYWIYSLAVNGNNIFAGTDNGVFRSTNNGTNWTQTSLNNRSVYSLWVDGNNIFAGTLNNGVYVSTDNGTSWTQRNEGLPNNILVNALCILNNYIFAGISSYNGVYRRPLSELIGIQPISNEVPNQFSLSQNYPNPFNPNSKIKMQIAKLSAVKLVVFDVLGREVSTLVNEELKPGTYEVDFDGANYSSGVYYYKLTADNYTETKKMVLIK